MAGVDNRIVTMKFDNREFERNAATSLSTMQKIKESMNFGSIVSSSVNGLAAISSALGKIGLKTPFSPMIEGAQKGLGIVSGMLDRLGLKNPFSSATQSASELQQAAANAGGPAGMGALEGGVTAVSSKFIAMSTIAITALSNIVNRAVNAGASFLKSFTLAPVMDGLREYELNLKSIQTVQANTDRPLPEINAALDELNQYSDQTIYNFAEMAKNVGTFTAAGVDLETSVSSIKGIANMAALSGSNSQQAATAMYQLSQAIASGKVGLMDWNSVVNAGMGGKKLQTALAETAIAMGDLDKAQLKGVESGEQLTIAGQSFRESIMAQPGQESWLSSEILTNSLAALDGRYSAAALSQEKLADGTLKYSSRAEVLAQIEKNRAAAAKEGVVYTDEQFKALQKLSTSSFEAATKVKTLGQVFEIAKETIASGWSASFRSIFGDLEEAKSLFTGMSEGLNDIINKGALARNEMLAAWKEGGGRTDVIEGLKSAWEAVYSIISAVGKGFRDIFPAKTAEDLIGMSASFRAFMAQLVPGEKTLANIRDIAGGVFSIFGIGAQILGGIVDGFKTLFGVVGSEGGSSFLGLAAGLGRTLKTFEQFLQDSGVVTQFFTTLGGIIAVPIKLLSSFAGVLGGLFSGFDTKGASGAMDTFSASTGRLADSGDRVMSIFSGLGDVVSKAGDLIASALSSIGGVIANAITPATFEGALSAINTALLGGIVLMLRKFFSGGLNFDVGGGFFSTATETLSSATTVLQNMQASLKADILLKIAGALGVMALSLLLLASIKAGDLTKALTAMSVGFAALGAVMVALITYIGPIGAMKLPLISASMIGLATAMLLFAGAMKIFTTMNAGEIARGLFAIGGTLFVLHKAMAPMAANVGGMIRAAIAITILGVALNVLAVAMKVFATMSWAEMIKGLAGLTGVLIALSIGLSAMPPLHAEAIGLIALGVAVNLLGVALKIFATMSWAEMAKGLTTLAISLGIIAVAIRSMPKTMILQSVALVAVAGALVVLAGALKIMGGMSWESVAKGLILLGGAMVIIAMGLNAIGLVGTIGAVGLMAAALALAVLVPVMVALGALSWESILKGLVGLAGVFVILGVAGTLLAPVLPVILGLSVALVLIGAGFALAGAGALAFASALAIFIAASVGSAKVLGQMLGSLVQKIPMFFGQLAKGLSRFAGEIAKSGPRFVRAFTTILGSMLSAIIKNTPKMGKAFTVMILTALKVIVTLTPKIVSAGLKLIISFLQAIEKNIGKITSLAIKIVVNFLNAISRNLSRIIQSGVNLIIKFIEGVTKAIDRNSTKLGEAGADLGIAIVKGMANGITGSAGQIADAAMSAARNALEAAKNFLRSKSPSKRSRDELGIPFGQGMAIGIDEEAGHVSDSARSMGRSALDTLKSTFSNMSDILDVDADMNPTITPVLDLSAMTKEANKMSSILAVAPIMPRVSYATAADISAMTQPPPGGEGGPEDGPGGIGGGGDTNVKLELHQHSPKPLDSVAAYRGGKTLIAIAKETLK